MEQQTVSKLLIVIMRLLLDGKYKEVEQLTNGQRYPAIELENAMKSHYQVLSMPPEVEFYELPITKVITKSSSEAIATVLDFWTDKNQRSDLSLECTFYLSENGVISPQIDNLHVM